MSCIHDDKPLDDGACYCSSGSGCCNANNKCICQHPGHDPGICRATHPHGWKAVPAGGPAAGPDRAPTATPSPASAQDMNAYTWHDPEDVVLVRTSADGPVIAYGVKR